MAFNSLLWKTEVLTCNSLWALLGEGDLHLQSLTLVPTSGYQCLVGGWSASSATPSHTTPGSATHTRAASTLAQQCQTLKLLIASYALDAQKGQSGNQVPEKRAVATFAVCVPQAKLFGNASKRSRKRVQQSAGSTNQTNPKALCKNKWPSVTLPLTEIAINPSSGKTFHCFQRQPQPFAKSGHSSKIQIPSFAGETDITCVTSPQLFSPLALSTTIHVAWPKLGSSGEETFSSGRGELAWPFLLAFTTAAMPFVEVPDKPPCPFLQAETGSSGMTLLSADKSRCSETGDSNAVQQIASAEPDTLPSEGLLSGYAW